MPIRLGRLEIHAESNEISGPGGRQRLEPQAVAVLELLAGAPGRVWSREELLDRAWKGRVVSDATLSGVISRLRRALSESGIEDVRIETRSKRGYRLVLNEALQARSGWLRGALGPGLIAIVLLAGFAFHASRLDPAERTPAPPDAIRLDLDITLPDGETTDAVILLRSGTDGRVRLYGDYPLDIRAVPVQVQDDLLRLRLEVTSPAHWAGFEQVIRLGTESRISLKSAQSTAVHKIRFVASRASKRPVPQETPR